MIKVHDDKTTGLGEGMTLQLFEATTYLFDNFGTNNLPLSYCCI
jgi:hypothetical protein